MGRKTLMILLFSLSHQLLAQTSITWEMLGDVDFTAKYVKKFEADFLFPVFGQSVKALDGKEVEIAGYVIVIDRKSGIYILSRYPNASCFFCGVAGPETIIELKLKTPHSKLKMDQTGFFRGTLKLNSDDIYQCNYILLEAELVE